MTYSVQKVHFHDFSFEFSKSLIAFLSTFSSTHIFSHFFNFKFSPKPWNISKMPLLKKLLFTPKEASHIYETTKLIHFAYFAHILLVCRQLTLHNLIKNFKSCRLTAFSCNSLESGKLSTLNGKIAFCSRLMKSKWRANGKRTKPSQVYSRILIIIFVKQVLTTFLVFGLI